MPTEPRPPVSRRKLGLFGFVAVIGAGLIVATGIRAREDSSARLQGMDRRPGDPDGSRRAAQRPGAQSDHRSAGPAGSLFARADLCARQRLSQELERRYRRQGQGRRRDRRDRGAGSRPAITAGEGRPHQPAIERATVGGDAEPAQDAARLQLRLDAGNRRAHRRPHQQEGRRQFRPGQCRTAGSAGRLQEDHRAVRRRRDLARDRCRCADQCRRRRGACDVRGLRHHQAARLCQRAAELRPGGQDRGKGRADDAGISEPDVRRDGRSLLAIGRCLVRGPRACSSRSTMPAAS